MSATRDPRPGGNGKHAPVNITLNGKIFGPRLCGFRQRRGVTKPELAESAGVSSRTVHNLEAGRQDRIKVQEKTLMLLAKALKTDLADLVGPAILAPAAAGDGLGEPLARAGRSLGRSRTGLAVALVVAVALAAAVAADTMLVEPNLAQGRLTGVSAVGKRQVWRLQVDAKVEFVTPSPWNEGDFLVGLGTDREDGGRLLLVAGRSGRICWSVGPGLDRAAAAFGPGVVTTSHCYISAAVVPVDMDGDGTCEVAAGFMHNWYAPYAVLLVDEAGTVLSQYDHRGHLYDFAVCDLDSDGRQELLAVGSNNAPCYQGATIVMLDGTCRHGTSSDSGAGGAAGIPDSARVRVVLPSFGEPYMSLLSGPRLEGRHVKVASGPDGSPRVQMSVGVHGMHVLVTLDRELRPLTVLTSDIMQTVARSWPEDARASGGPQSNEWLAGWLQGAVRFEAGHWAGGAGESGEAIQARG